MSQEREHKWRRLLNPAGGRMWSGVGCLAMLYGLVAALMGKTFLPGLHARWHMATGRSAYALAAAYVLGGLYLLLRFRLDRRARTDDARHSLYLMQVLTLIAFIVVLIYVLVNVGVVQ
jgi:hypothetical protein